ncbi:MAG: histidine kinase dimerization/phospho-acceptor domain-containing protein [Methylocystis sp.]|uniref:sensor histidine kinase n=1 Tax=Methylocystis sp. TaxID=1911079 RepID=UPI00392CE7A7
MVGSQEELELGARAAACVADDAVFSALDAAGTPIIVASGDPLHIDFMNDSARAAFGDDAHALGERLFRGDEPGARRLAECASELLGELRGDDLRVERLRFRFAGAARTIAFLCRSLESIGGGFFVVAALGLGAKSPADAAPAVADGDEAATLRRSSAGRRGAGDATPPLETDSGSSFEKRFAGPSADSIVTLRPPASARGGREALETLSSSERIAFDEIARALKEGAVAAADATPAHQSALEAPKAQQPTALQRDREFSLPGPEQSALALARALEEKLARAKSESALLGAVFERAQTPLAILTTDGMILRANARFAACLGADPREAQNRSLASLLGPADAQNVAQRLSRALSDERARLSLSRPPPGGGGAPFDLALRLLPVEEKPVILVSLEANDGADASDGAVEAARLAAESANAAKSDFLARVSHEIRTPLNAIIGFAEVMMEERLGPIGSPRYREYLKDIHVSGAHVLSLVNDLLDLSKIEAGKMELSFTPVDANAVIAECASMMQPQANQARVVLRLALAPGLPPLSADPRSLKQILLNLLSNAVKFNEPGGQVIVSSALNDAGFVVIRVKDTGIGMSEEEIATALEPFRQVDTARKKSGTGLGLPLTKALIEANHASFRVKSGRNEGTLIEIAFAPPQEIAAE